MKSALIIPNTYPAVEHSGNIVLYDFAETDGKIIDGSGAGNHGAVTDAIAVATPLGLGRYFNGSTAKIVTAKKAVFDTMSKQMTLEVWARPDLIDVGGIDGDLAGAGSWANYRISQVYDYWKMSMNYADATTKEGTWNLTSAGIWYHLVLTAERNKFLDLYVNGLNRVHYAPPNIPDSDLKIGNYPFVLGSDNGSFFWTGTLGYVRLSTLSTDAHTAKRLYQQRVHSFGKVA